MGRWQVITIVWYVLDLGIKMGKGGDALGTFIGYALVFFFLYKGGFFR